MKEVAIVLLCLCLPIAVNAQIYKWVDASGQTHYSQTPPPGKEAKTINIRKENTDSHAAKEVAPAPFKSMASNATDVVLGAAKTADTLNCEQAVKNVHSSIDSMMQTAQTNLDSGYMDGDQFAKGSQDLLVAKSKATVQDCENSSGPAREFYLCMTNGASHYLGCSQRFSP